MKESIAQMKKEMAEFEQFKQRVGGEGGASAALLQEHASKMTKKQEELKKAHATLKQAEDDYEEAAKDLEEFGEALDDLTTQENANAAEMETLEADQEAVGYVSERSLVVVLCFEASFF